MVLKKPKSAVAKNFKKLATNVMWLCFVAENTKLTSD